MRVVVRLDERSIKAGGIHYTPPELASFLAEVAVRHAALGARALVALDPACGDGGLLRAVADAVPLRVRRRLRLVGFETDPSAVSNAEANLRRLGVAGVDIREGDFLDAATAGRATSSLGPLFAVADDAVEKFDIVISNPPYVRTQVLGAKRAQRLASLFGLTGRVDLYHAFVKAISAVLRPGGILGLLTSNRFMLIESGASVREMFRREFALCDLYDLGDTRLFQAAVLPAVVVARRTPGPVAAPCPFTRVYEVREGPADHHAVPKWPTVLEALKGSATGVIQTGEGWFRVDRGELAGAGDRKDPWSLSSPRTRSWLRTVHANRHCSFEEVGHVRVGIKTTADPVFVRDDWDSLPRGLRPEAELLHPLITHHVAARWRSAAGAELLKRVLYPHEEGPDGSKRPVDLALYPRTRAYLLQYRDQLEARRYVIEAGRKWYEIWVPQHPRDWARPKLVYPDISEQPRFFLDTTGAVVNGDCYWITLHDAVPKEWLYLVLAVANSSFITAYYDIVFHNKLYAGRRRFMTQYVSRFPLPRRDSPEARRIIRIVSTAFSGCPTSFDGETEQELDGLVWSSFGLRKNRRVTGSGAFDSPSCLRTLGRS